MKHGKRVEIILIPVEARYLMIVSRLDVFPVGRKEFRRVGGGLKKTWLWVDLMRRGPTSGPLLIERVIRIVHSDCHTAKVALIGHGNTMRYILATENLKVGDLVKTSGEIPKNPGKSFSCRSISRTSSMSF